MNLNTNGTDDPRSELRDAIGEGELERVREILDVQPELLNTATSNDGATPLMDAVSSMERTPELIKFLLERGADVHARTCKGYTALHCAVDVDGESCQGELPKTIIRMLIDAGADLEAKQHWGWTPLMRAVLEGTADEVQALCDVGARVDHVYPEHTLPECKRGDTMLMAIVYDPEIIKILLEAGADPYQKGLYGMNAIERVTAELRKSKSNHPVENMEDRVSSVLDTDPRTKECLESLGDEFRDKFMRDFREFSTKDHRPELEESLRLLTEHGTIRA